MFEYGIMIVNDTFVSIKRSRKVVLFNSIALFAGKSSFK